MVATSAGTGGEVRLVDLDVIKRYSLAVRQEWAPAEEVLAVLDATRDAVLHALGLGHDASRDATDDANGEANGEANGDEIDDVTDLATDEATTRLAGDDEPSSPGRSPRGRRAARPPRRRA